MGLAPLWQGHRELPHPVCPVRAQWEDSIYEPESRFSPDSKSAGFLIMDFQLPDSEKEISGAYKPSWL